MSAERRMMLHLMTCWSGGLLVGGLVSLPLIQFTVSPANQAGAYQSSGITLLTGLIGLMLGLAAKRNNLKGSNE